MNLFLDACAIIYLIEAGSEQGKTVRKIVTQHLFEANVFFNRKKR